METPSQTQKVFKIGKNSGIVPETGTPPIITGKVTGITGLEHTYEKKLDVVTVKVNNISFLKIFVLQLRNFTTISIK